MRPSTILLLLLILATSAYSMISEDDELYKQDYEERYEMDELEKKEVCRDRMSRCSRYIQYCSRSQSIRKYCPKTCNACTQQCDDKDNRCTRWISYCSRSSWVRDNCKKTCNQCNSPTKPRPRPTKPRPRPTLRPQIPRCDPDKIEQRSCVEWKARGFCKRSSDYFSFMKKTCPGNCGFCRGYKVVTPAPERPHTTRVNIRECLEAHNKNRRRHGAKPLRWDSNMAKEAQDYALKLATIKQMKHDSSIQGTYGENLAYSYHSSGTEEYTCKDATKAWYDEIKDYSFSNPGFSSKTGHFTQVVWKASKRLGVGIARNGGYTYVVARYSPPGNYQGQFAENVGGPLY